jgi:hypothetical protein
MSHDVPASSSISGKAVASIFLALVSLPLVLRDARGMTETGLLLILSIDLVSLALAALALTDVWRGRAGGKSILPALGGAGLALVGMSLAWDLREVQKGTERRMSAANDLKQLAVALFDYERAHGRLPPAVLHGQVGKPLLSWRVLILPYLEQEGLYKEFHLDEAWDSPHNRLLLARMPKVYGPPEGVATPQPFTTFYRVFVGKGAAFEGPEGVKLTDFPDGPEETFLVVTAGEAVPWTKPEELPYTPGEPLPALGGIFRHDFYAAFADGSIQRVLKTASEATLRALITRNAGDKPGQDW